MVGGRVATLLRDDISADNFHERDDNIDHLFVPLSSFATNFKINIVNGLRHDNVLLPQGMT